MRKACALRCAWVGELAPASPSVGGWLGVDHLEADDLSVANGEVVRHYQLGWEVGLVVGAVVARANDGLAVVVDDLDRLHRYVVSDHLLFDPASDGIHAVDLSADIVDVGVGGESCHDCVDIEGVDPGDVVSDDRGKGCGHGPAPFHAAAPLAAYPQA